MVAIYWKVSLFKLRITDVQCLINALLFEWQRRKRTTVSCLTRAKVHYYCHPVVAHRIRVRFQWAWTTATTRWRHWEDKMHQYIDWKKSASYSRQSGKCHCCSLRWRSTGRLMDRTMYALMRRGLFVSRSIFQIPSQLVLLDLRGINFKLFVICRNSLLLY